MASDPQLHNGDVTQENGHEPQNGSLSKKTKQEKNKERKLKKKQNKQQRRQELQEQKTKAAKPAAAAQDDDIIIEYVTAPVDLDALKPSSSQQLDEYEYGGAATFGLGTTPGLGSGTGLGFSDTPGLGILESKPQQDPLEDLKRVIERFTQLDEAGSSDEEGKEDAEDEEPRSRQEEQKKATTSDADSDSDDDEEGGNKSKVSKKQRKLLNRLKIAELKQICHRPDVVEVWDVTSNDPQLLVFLKGYRNSVTVPRHWSQKRKYLQGKRGIEKPAFKLPDFIEATGISQIRETYLEKEESKKLKQKQRERMAPKVGRMNIDYQVLHDAFFKHQTKPKLSILGELYYEGKEFEARIENLKPGVLSADLKEALGMMDGSPPPWLINMQRYGPPPSYPNLKVPGLNAPIPPGATFGYHPGGWGKPPVDEDGNPLYGDVFGQYAADNDTDDELDKETRWGEMDEEEEEESEEEESEEEDEEGMGADDYQAGIQSGMASGMASDLSGITSSLPSGIETPDTVNLRKATESAEPRPLYQVLEQKAVPIAPGTIMGTDHVYVIPGATEKAKEKRVGDKKRQEAMRGMAVEDVEVALTAEELEGLTAEEIQRLYDSRMAEEKAKAQPESFSDMVAGHVAAQKRKLAAKSDQKAKKSKDTFKF